MNQKDRYLKTYLKFNHTDEPRITVEKMQVTSEMALEFFILLSFRRAFFTNTQVLLMRNKD